MSVDAFVPVRGGSKGVPGKNIKSFCGKPLLYWVVSELLSTEEIDRVFVSSDSELIKKAVMEYFYDYWPEKLFFNNQSQESARDKAMWEEAVMEHIRSQEGYYRPEDLLLMAQVTSPFTTQTDFSTGIALYKDGLQNVKSDQTSLSVVTCVRIHRFIWDYYTHLLKLGTPLNYNHMNRPRRQDFKGLLVENGAFCINSIKGIQQYNNRLTRNTLIHEMPEYTFTEIDTEDDWLIAEALFKKHRLDKI